MPLSIPPLNWRKMRYLAIDLGAKRTGLAVGDDATRIVTPLEIIATSNAAERLRQIARAVADHEPDALVVGLPVNMDDSPAAAAKSVQNFAAELGQRFKLPVHLIDERLTSYAAEQQMNQTGLTHKGKKSRRDALAAAAILRDFLDQPGHG
jgi:putative holliday junction resolvase